MHDDAAESFGGESSGDSSQCLQLVNLTPHRVVLETLTVDGEAEHLVLPPADVVPRLVITAGETSVIRLRGGSDSAAGVVIPIVGGTRATRIEPPLPEMRPGVLYVTSRALAEQMPERTDLVWPEDQIRDHYGNVVGARRLGRVGSADL